MELIAVHEKTSELIEQLTNVWERSVKASHLFLSASEIDEIKEYIPKALQEVGHLVIAVNESGFPVAFMGVENGKLEMLFIAPEECGKGLGKRIIKYGMETLSVLEVTVNEQNKNALGFYEHMGFKVYKRTDIDEQGIPYPLLYMKLQTNDYLRE